MTQTEAQKQIAQFSRLRKWDCLTSEAVAGLAATLAAVAATPEAGRHITEEIIARQDEVPTEHEIRELARGLNPVPEDKPLGRPDCQRCGGSGWLIIERGDYSAAEPCPCWKPPQEASCRTGAPQGMAGSPPARPRPVSAAARGILDGGAA